MLHQESRDWADVRSSVAGAEAPVAVIAYRSRAVSRPTRADLNRLLLRAQERNRLEGLTGLLIYDQGHYFQWLEGPRPGLMRVWDSIRSDVRHRDIKLLRHGSVPTPFFKNWDMRLAHRARGDIETTLTVMQAPSELLSTLKIQPTVLAGKAWDEVFSDVVIPSVKLAHIAEYRKAAAPAAGALWHAHRNAASELAALLLAVNPGDTATYVDGLISQGAGLEPLYHEVFEPAARHLGGLWEDDRCAEFSVTSAMGRLQLEVHRLSTVLIPEHHAMQPGHAILIAALPGESHGLHASMGSELFTRDGWDVSSEIINSDKVLHDLLHRRWFDVLDLSLSAALRRDQRLPAMGVTIRAARAASLNPALAIMVDGRSFFDRPQAYLDVGADVGYGTSTDAVPAAQLLLDAVALRRPAVRELIPPSNAQVRAFYRYRATQTPREPV